MLPDDDVSQLVLVIDQFEELFTLASSEQRQAFLASVAAAVGDERSRSVRVIVTVRADFYDRPLQDPDGQRTRAGEHCGGHAIGGGTVGGCHQRPC